MKFLLVGALTYLAVLAATFAARALGRFLVARRSGLKIAKLIIGAGRTLREWKSGGPVPIVELRTFPFFVRLIFADDSPGAPAAPGTFAFASDRVRFLVVFAGLAAIYALASICSFVAHQGGGVLAPTTQVDVIRGGEAERAGMHNGDRIAEVNGAPVSRWSGVRKAINEASGASVEITVERGGERLPMRLTPTRNATGTWTIGIVSKMEPEPVSLQGSLFAAIATPWRIASQRAAAVFGSHPPPEETAASHPWPWSAIAMAAELISGWFLLLVLPLPGLDGARLGALALEWATGKRLGRGTWSRIESLRLLFPVAGVLLITALLITAVQPSR